MLINAIVGADYADEQINPDTRRSRFIALTADSSAFGAGSHVFTLQVMCIYRTTSMFDILSVCNGYHLRDRF
jgi:hypothetical protein